MRSRKSESGLTVNAVGGTHVVLLGLDLESPKRKGCLGFAIQRNDVTEDETYWMSGMKTFAKTDPGLGPGGQASSHDHPFQSFQWSDYSAKPNHQYRYRVVPMYGEPAKLREGDDVTVSIQTESEFSGKHSVFFNRGAVASQEYARRFQNKKPSALGDADRAAAYKWLSRGLLEAFEAFVGRATGAGFSLYGAFYEFQWTDALSALREAKSRGVTLEILFDEIPGASGPAEKNVAAIAEEKLKAVCEGHTHGKIMHNKFLVLLKGKAPQAIWTGSTNLTENGIFGHSNCGHVVEDTEVAARYLAYWRQLQADPDHLAVDREWVQENNPDPPDPLTQDTTLIFSPRSGLSVLERYAAISAEHSRPLFMTFAFGMHEVFKEVYRKDDGVLRFALMDKEGNGAGLAKAKKEILEIRRLPNVVVAVGNNIPLNSFDRWLKEIDRVTAKVNVRWIHNKYMLVDPLSDIPTVITGSANFSVASTNANHENMLVIRNNTRVADIYFGEFMRLHAHYAFREAVKIAQENNEKDWEPKDLIPTDAWQEKGRYFKKGDQRSLRREYFSRSQT
jgi:phosphatidylserine/phosphatidylglycerophosphate/cardiolipin synthase-like enzyme